MSRLSMIVRVNVVLNRSVVNKYGRFENLCSSPIQDYVHPDDHA